MQGMIEILYLWNFKCFHDLYLFIFEFFWKIAFKGLSADGWDDDLNRKNACVML